MDPFKVDPSFDYSQLSDKEIESALTEIQRYHKTNILEDGIVRRIADSAQDRLGMPYSQALRLSREALFQEVANRWIEAKARLDRIELD